MSDIKGKYVICGWGEATHALCVSNEEREGDALRWARMWAGGDAIYEIGQVYKTVAPYMPNDNVLVEWPGTNDMLYCPRRAFIPLRPLQTLSEDERGKYDEKIEYWRTFATDRLNDCRSLNSKCVKWRNRALMAEQQLARLRMAVQNALSTCERQEEEEEWN